MEENLNNTQFANRKRARPALVNPFEQGKLQPQAVDVEEIVLGSLMLEKDAVAAVIDLIKPEVFYKEQHQIIFKAIHDLFSKTEPVDIITVTNELKRTGKLEAAGGAYYITQLTSRIASAANIEFHSGIVLQKYLQRELIRISTDTITRAYEDTTDVFNLLDDAERDLFAISENNLRRKTENIPELIRRAVRNIEAARKLGTGLTGIPSGFTALDRITGGWQRSDLIVVASRPAMGKTAFALSMARNMAVDHKKPVAIFSLEMESIQLVTRLISGETSLPQESLKKGDLHDYEWEQLNAKVGRLEDAPIYIDDTSALSIFELRAKCRRLKAQHDIECVIIDYIQLMTAGGEAKGNREQEIALISRSLKTLAKELNVPVIALAQLNRSVETRPGNKKPLLSDLRESGAIEQDADMVCFLYRPEYYHLDEDEHGSTLGKADVIIAKHRNGSLGEVRLKFMKQYARFDEPEEEIPGFEGNAEMPVNASFETGGNKAITRQSKMNDMPEDNDPFPA